MDDNRVLAVEVEDPDLQRCAVTAGSDEHGQVIVHLDLADGGPDAMPDVGVAHAMLAGRYADPHQASLSLRSCSVNKCCLPMLPRPGYEQQMMCPNCCRNGEASVTPSVCVGKPGCTPVSA